MQDFAHFSTDHYNFGRANRIGHCSKQHTEQIHTAAEYSNLRVLGNLKYKLFLKWGGENYSIWWGEQQRHNYKTEQESPGWLQPYSSSQPGRSVSVRDLMGLSWGYITTPQHHQDNRQHERTLVNHVVTIYILTDMKVYNMSSSTHKSHLKCTHASTPTC